MASAHAAAHFSKRSTMHCSTCTSFFNSNGLIEVQDAMKIAERENPL